MARDRGNKPSSGEGPLPPGGLDEGPDVAARPVEALADTAKPAEQPAAKPRSKGTTGGRMIVRDAGLAAVGEISAILSGIESESELVMVLGWVLNRYAPPGFSFSTHNRRPSGGNVTTSGGEGGGG